MFAQTRRQFLQSTTATTAAFALGEKAWAAQDNPYILANSEVNVPIRCLTSGPKHHWYGYYDKLQFDPTNTLVLSNEVDFEHRSPTADDMIRVGMIDTANGDQWTELGSSAAWGWQQGCMLQWRPKSSSEVLWNDRRDGRFVCHVKDVKSGSRRTLTRPIYAVSPTGETAITADFARIDTMRPGYGYEGIEDPFAAERMPEGSGIWNVPLDGTDPTLIVSIADVAKIPHQGKVLSDKWHYFNHLLFNTDGTRFIFLHRWKDDPNNRRFYTRMFTANADGSDLYLLDPSGKTSHFIWRDPDHICAWTQPVGKPAKFYLFEDQTDNVAVVGPDVMVRNGHNTYVPGTNGEWILNDTYPQGELRQQVPYLYHVPSGKRFDLGRFHLPAKYTGEWRCDLHPRSSNDCGLVTIDSPHGGAGRQVWLLDVSEILKSV